MRNSEESLLGESYSPNKLHYKKAARVMHCKVLFIDIEHHTLATTLTKNMYSTLHF